MQKPSNSHRDLVELAERLMNETPDPERSRSLLRWRDSRPRGEPLLYRLGNGALRTRDFTPSRDRQGVGLRAGN
jgi:hypothetical protein